MQRKVDWSCLNLTHSNLSLLYNVFSSLYSKHLSNNIIVQRLCSVPGVYNSSPFQYFLYCLTTFSVIKDSCIKHTSTFSVENLTLSSQINC